MRALQLLGLLGVLETLFDEVLVPPGVQTELCVRVGLLPELRVEAIPGVRIVSPRDERLLGRLRESLGRGEAEALTLAVETKASAVLIDESAGRRAARALGLTALGALGVLVRAKRVGAVPAVAPLIGRLEAELGFRVSAEVRKSIIELAQE